MVRSRSALVVVTLALASSCTIGADSRGAAVHDKQPAIPVATGEGEGSVGEGEGSVGEGEGSVGEGEGSVGEGEGAVGEGEGAIGEGEGEGAVGEGEGEGVVGEGEGEGEGVARPASVLSTGFFRVGGDIYDPSGVKFVMRGINHTHWWGDQASNLAAVDELPKTGANIVRAVFGPNMGADTPAEKREVVARYVANHMPVIVEDHAATCGTDPAQIASIVDTWLLPDNVSWLHDYEKNVIVNIANEWGPQDDDIWSSTYETAISRLRAGGVHNMIVIDAGGGCGQYVGTVRDRWSAIEDADPEHNTVFSVHMYGFWRTSEATDTGSWGSDGAPWSIRNELTAAQTAGIPIIAGEIGWQDDDQVGYQTQEALQIFKDLDIGFVAWSWNQNSDATYDLRVGGTAYTYSGPQDLTPGGQALLLDPSVGIQATSVQATGLLP